MIRSATLFALACLPLGAADINITDSGGRGFAPGVVAYGVAAADAAAWRVTGPDGKPVPVQVVGQGDAAQLLFPAELAAGASATWKIERSGAAGPGEVTVQEEAGNLVLSNGRAAIRVPKVQTRGKTALKDLPAPILAFKPEGGSWCGAGTMLAGGDAAAFRMVEVAKGPVRAEYRYELDLANGGTYRATIRLDAREPHAEIIEEYDLKGGAPLPGWQLDLTAGWAPDQTEWTKAVHNGDYNPQRAPIAEFAKKDVSNGGGGYGVGGSNKQPGEVGVAKRHVCRHLAPDDNWSGDQAIYLGLSAGTTQVGWVTLNKGAWRRPTAIPVWTDGTAMQVQMPIGVRPMSWLTEVSSDEAVLSYHTHDPALPTTFGRRCWGLALAPTVPSFPKAARHEDMPFLRTRMFYGTMDLDRYKDLHLTWDDSAAKRPAVFITPELVAAVRGAQGPGAEGLSRWYNGTGDEAKARINAEEAERQIDSYVAWLLTSPAIGHHQARAFIACLVEDALSWPGLPADQRQRLLSKTALVAYLCADPDVMHAGNGSHGGPANMQIALKASSPFFSALIPTHPMAKAWNAYWGDWHQHVSSYMSFAGGAWAEFGKEYQMHGFGRVSQAALAHHAAGAPAAPELEAKVANTWRYTLDMLTAPDSRVGGQRVIVGGHNSPPGFSYQFLEGIGCMLPINPKLAGNLQWAWQHNGSETKNWNLDTIIGLWARPQVKAIEPQLGSVNRPGWGVVMRAHQGDNETWLNLRGGSIWGHAYEDQGNFSFMSRGAVLVPWQSYQYYWPENKSFALYNTVRFGHPENQSPFAWPDATVAEHAFAARADYARVSVGFPAWYIEPGQKSGFGDKRLVQAGIEQKQGDVRHDRQVALVKSDQPTGLSYVVVRDTVSGSGRLASWLNLNLLGQKSDLTRNGPTIAQKTESGQTLDLRFVQDGLGEVATAEDQLDLVQTQNWNGQARVKELMAGKPVPANWVRKDGKPADFSDNLPDKERRLIVRVAGAPGGEYHWLLLPRLPSEKAPTITRLAPGVVKVQHAEGTDWILLAPTQTTFKDAEMEFTGTVGVVRVATDGSLDLQLGAGGSLAYKGTGIASSSAAARHFAKAALKPGIETIAGADIKALDGLTHTAIATNGNVYAKDGVTISGGRGGVQALTGGAVRFVALDATFTELTSGTAGVRGQGPFDLTMTKEGWTGTVGGEQRTLVMTLPPAIIRPQLTLDGTAYAIWWPDEPNPWRGRSDIQWSASVGVNAGSQKLDIREQVWPALPPVPVRAKL